MTFKKLILPGLLALGAFSVGVMIADPALAQAPAAAAAAAVAEPTVNKGDNAWMLVSTVLVLLMTIPGLALFYGGLVRAKNFLSVLSHVFYCVCIVTIIWVIYGYSVTFTGGSEYIGGLSKMFMSGITPDSKAATFSVGANISELVYLAFLMTFAAIKKLHKHLVAQVFRFLLLTIALE